MTVSTTMAVSLVDWVRKGGRWAMLGHRFSSYSMSRSDRTDSRVSRGGKFLLVVRCSHAVANRTLVEDIRAHVRAGAELAAQLLHKGRIPAGRAARPLSPPAPRSRVRSAARNAPSHCAAGARVDPAQGHPRDPVQPGVRLSR